MKKIRGRIGLVATLSTVSSIATTVIFAFVFKSLQQGIIASLIVIAILLIVELRSVLEIDRLDSRSNLLHATDKIVTLLRVHNDYFHDVGMFEMLNTIVKLREVAQKRHHDLFRFDRIISYAIERAEQEIGQVFKITTGDDELDRSIRIKDAIIHSEKYVYALTYDENNYLNRFWAGNFGREYIESNLQASKRGVEIQRIFIVDKKIIDGKNLSSEESHKRERLINLSKALEKAKPRCRIFWVSKEDIPDKLKCTNTSFLVCDDYIGSESNGCSEGANVIGYVSYGDRLHVVNPLKDRFERLRRYTENIPLV